MSDTQAAQVEFSALDEKRKSVGLNSDEQYRWYELAAQLNIDTAQLLGGTWGADGQWYPLPQQPYPPDLGYAPQYDTGQQYAVAQPGYQPLQPGYGYPPQPGYDPNAAYGYPPQQPQYYPPGYQPPYDPNAQYQGYVPQPGYAPQPGWPAAAPSPQQWPQGVAAPAPGPVVSPPGWPAPPPAPAAPAPSQSLSGEQVMEISDGEFTPLMSPPGVQQHLTVPAPLPTSNLDSVGDLRDSLEGDSELVIPGGKPPTAPAPASAPVTAPPAAAKPKMPLFGGSFAAKLAQAKPAATTAADPIPAAAPSEPTFQTIQSAGALLPQPEEPQEVTSFDSVESPAEPEVPVPAFSAPDPMPARDRKPVTVDFSKDFSQFDSSVRPLPSDMPPELGAGPDSATALADAPLNQVPQAQTQPELTGSDDSDIVELGASSVVEVPALGEPAPGHTLVELGATSEHVAIAAPMALGDAPAAFTDLAPAVTEAPAAEPPPLPAAPAAEEAPRAGNTPFFGSPLAGDADRATRPLPTNAPPSIFDALLPPALPAAAPEAVPALDLSALMPAAAPAPAAPTFNAFNSDGVVPDFGASPPPPAPAEAPAAPPAPVPMGTEVVYGFTLPDAEPAVPEADPSAVATLIPGSLTTDFLQAAAPVEAMEPQPQLAHAEVAPLDPAPAFLPATEAEQAPVGIASAAAPMLTSPVEAAPADLVEVEAPLLEVAPLEDAPMAEVMPEVVAEPLEGQVVEAAPIEVAPLAAEAFDDVPMVEVSAESEPEPETVSAPPVTAAVDDFFGSMAPAPAVAAPALATPGNFDFSQGDDAFDATSVATSSGGIDDVPWSQGRDPRPSEPSIIIAAESQPAPAAVEPEEELPLMAELEAEPEPVSLDQTLRPSTDWSAATDDTLRPQAPAAGRDLFGRSSAVFDLSEPEGNPADPVELATAADLMPATEDPRAISMSADTGDAFDVQSGPLSNLAGNSNDQSAEFSDGGETLQLASNVDFLQHQELQGTGEAWSSNQEGIALEESDEEVIQGIVLEDEPETEIEVEPEPVMAPPIFAPPVSAIAAPPPPVRAAPVAMPAPVARPVAPAAPAAAPVMGPTGGDLWPAEPPPRVISRVASPIAPPGTPVAPAGANVVMAPVRREDLFGAPPPRSRPTDSMPLPGEYRVILHTTEGQVKRGGLRDADLASETISLEGVGGVEAISQVRVKAIFFMLAPGSKLPPHQGAKVRVTFKDGRQVSGYSTDHQSDTAGFFVVPADNRTNTERIFIYRHGVQTLSVDP